MLALFCLMSALYNLLVFAYVPVTTAVCRYYNSGTCDGSPDEIVSIEYVRAARDHGGGGCAHTARGAQRACACVREHSAVFLLCAVTLITSIPLFLSGPVLMVKISLAASMWALCITSSVGAVLRYAFNSPSGIGYATALAGQFIISLGQLVTWAGPTRVRTPPARTARRARLTRMHARTQSSGSARAGRRRCRPCGSRRTSAPWRRPSVRVLGAAAAALRSPRRGVVLTNASAAWTERAAASVHVQPRRHRHRLPHVADAGQERRPRHRRWSVSHSAHAVGSPRRQGLDRPQRARTHTTAHASAGAQWNASSWST